MTGFERIGNTKMLKRFVRHFFNIAGFDISKTKNRNLYGYDLETEANKAIEKIHKHTMVGYPRLVTLYQQAVFCEQSNLDGSFVECGTWKGGSIGLAALANLKHSSTRRHIHLFDSFEGIPEPDNSVDGSRAIKQVQSVRGGTSGRLVPVKGFYDKYADGVGTLEINRDLMENVIGYDSNFLHYHKGWFQETLPLAANEIGKIAILRLDGDWYASTKVCLENLYSNVVSGGFVIIDDYGEYDGCKKAVDEFINKQKIKSFMHFIDQAGRYWIKS